MKAKLTPAEERLVAKIFDESWEQLEDTVDEMNAYRQSQWYVPKEQDSSLFLLQCKSFNLLNLRIISFFNR